MATWVHLVFWREEGESLQCEVFAEKADAVRFLKTRNASAWLQTNAVRTEAFTG